MLLHYLLVVTRGALDPYPDTKILYLMPGLPRLLESLGFFPKISRTWKILKSDFGSRKSWKLKTLESPGIYLWFKLTNTPSKYRTPCVNKCMKYSCRVLTEQFLCNLWWTFCDGLYCHTVYTE